ncbi:alpha/beta hydrolase [Comamonas endophytica]|uniref:Dienelactone hydrolase family protein n=1 Tax=Comamonas endophytica TaxID=2949090 RepID=A0ABY6GG39_9BURK|nr:MULTISPECIES: dienelactone hydrolase family protein [unclassified Acidovorax]MCD2514551.1 dienelactone hydrolase family protein [Acidovorax sp. D4N7]UYG53332.1 dienelactone hydrolase family protein [Acidovorax sp. 5MLIR]
MTDLPLEFLQREPLEAGDGPWLLVLMHGVGSNAQDLFGLAPYVPAHFHVLSLRAPYPMGPQANAWFQFTVDRNGTRHIDVEQERDARALLGRTLAQVQQQLDIAPERTVVGGFSQGGIMALSQLLTQPQSLRAAMVWHSRLLPEVRSLQAQDAQFEGKSLWISHGTHDNVIPLTSAHSMRSHVQALPLALSYREFESAHEIRPDELRASMQWLEGLR